MGSIGGPHSNDTRSGTPSGMGGGMQRQLSSDGLERPPSMGAGSCKDEGNIFIIAVENVIIILNPYNKISIKNILYRCISRFYWRSTAQRCRRRK